MDNVGDKCGGTNTGALHFRSNNGSTSAIADRRIRDWIIRGNSWDTGADVSKGGVVGGRCVIIQQLDTGAAGTSVTDSYIRDMHFDGNWMTYRDGEAVRLIGAGTMPIYDISFVNNNFQEAASVAINSVIKCGVGGVVFANNRYSFAEHTISSNTTYAIETTAEVYGLVIGPELLLAPTQLLQVSGSATAAGLATWQVLGSNLGGGRIQANRLSAPQTTATIASGAITYAGSFMIVDTQGAAASDDLDTINGGNNGEEITIMSTASARDIVLRHGVGNIFLNGGVNATLGQNYNTISLLFRTGIGWCETGRNIT
jgi:hypothetical protein